MPVDRVTGIINGQRAVTAEFWLNLQKPYELRLARQEVGDRVDRLPRLTDRMAARRILMRLARFDQNINLVRFVAARRRTGQRGVVRRSAVIFGEPSLRFTLLATGAAP